MNTLSEQSVMPQKPILPLCVCGDPLCRILYGYCHCGCGAKTWIASYSSPQSGYRKGMPMKFAHGHHGRIRPSIEQAVPFKIDGVYCRLIPLSQGLHAIVDAIDYEWLMQWKWYARKKQNGTPGFYVFRNIWRLNGKHVLSSMHRAIAEVCGLPNVDHRDGCGLNNTRKNLRPCSVSQNGANRGKQANNSSGYKGVCWIKARQKFRARVRYNGKDILCGYFDLAEDAARAYDRKAIEIFGEFAQLNFPDERVA